VCRTMLQWLRRRQAARRGWRKADAEALIRDHALRPMARLACASGTTHAGRTPAHWGRVALIVVRMTGKRVGLDTAAWMRERRDDGVDR
jgi:hypothetical protein